MNRYKHFSFEEREAIEKGIKKGISLTKIALNIKRSASGVFLEVRINGGRDAYNAERAQERHSVIRSQAYKLNGHKNSYERKKISFDLLERVSNLEMQVEILTEIIKERK